jgi:adenosylhomocysteine nucleosidase
MSVRIGVIAAFEAELRPLVRGWRREKSGVYHGRRAGATVIAVAGGMGAHRAEAAARTALEAAAGAAQESGPLAALVSLGWAGGASCGVQPGIAYPVVEVIDAEAGRRFAGRHPGSGPVRLATLDHVAGRAEKRQLAERLGASLVDMEAAAVARMAESQGAAFYCWKAVTDIATEDLPDFNRFLSADGQLMIPRLAAYVVTHPGYAAPLLRMGRNGRRGAEALARAVGRWIDEGGYADGDN